MTTQDNQFLADVLQRLEFARTVHQGNGHLFAALASEVGELADALIDREGFDRVWAEAVDVAVVALRIAAEGDPDFEVAA